VPVLKPKGRPPALRWPALLAVALIIATAVGVWHQVRRIPRPDPVLAVAATSTPEGAPPAAPPAAVTPLSSESATPDAQAVETEDGAPEAHFRTNARGELILDTRTRLGVEALVGIYAPAQRLARLQQLQASLPPAAYARLVELIDRYRNYLVASRQLYPPEAPRTDAGDALREFEDLRGLRRTYFGREAAEALYGDEEHVTRELLEKMQHDATPGLTLEQKAERAQGTITPHERHP